MLAYKGALLNAVVGDSINSQEVSRYFRILQTNPQNLRNAMRRWTSHEGLEVLLWTLPKRRGRSDILNVVTAKWVVDWWTHETRVSSCKKDTVNNWIAPGTYNTHAAHYLTETQTNFFLQFKEANPGHKVQERYFTKLRPYFIRPLRDRNVCCCIYHVEMQMLKDGLNRMRDVRLGIHRHHSEFCFCDVCHSTGTDGRADCFAHNKAYPGITVLWESCVFSKGELQLWHDQKCLLGTCINCGVERKLKFCPEEMLKIQSCGSHGEGLRGRLSAEIRRLATTRQSSQKRIRKRLHMKWLSN